MQSPFVNDYEIWGVEDGAVSIVIDENPAMEWFEGDVPFWFEFDNTFNMVVGSSEERIVLREFPARLAHSLEDIGCIMVIETANGQIVRCTPVTARGVDITRRAA